MNDEDWWFRIGIAWWHARYFLLTLFVVMIAITVFTLAKG